MFLVDLFLATSSDRLPAKAINKKKGEKKRDRQRAKYYRALAGVKECIGLCTSKQSSITYLDQKHTQKKTMSANVWYACITIIRHTE